jgi:phytoene dehydrogenase-like protein
MSDDDGLDAIVVGSGPNGLTAAVTLAAAGLRVRVYEAEDGVGGGARTAELTLPGFRHDVCSAVHPFGVGSPVFAALPLADHGLEWIEPELALTHPLPDGSGAVLARSLEETMASLGDGGRGYRSLVRPFVGRWWEVADDVLRPIGSTWPAHPLLLSRLGVRAVLPASAVTARLRGVAAPALFAGMAAHAGEPLTTPFTTAFGLMLAVAGHDVGWPVPRGGSQAITDALVSYLEALGGEVVTGHSVGRLADLPAARAYLLDTSAWALRGLAGDRLPGRYLARLDRFRAGVGVFKLDYALSGPVPWRAEVCRRSGTVHVGGPATEVAAALRAVRAGRPAERPLVVTAQPSLFDSTRAPAGQHTFWAYAHVPSGWSGDATDAIEDQLERFAPGFRDLVLARVANGPADLEARNANYVGGDISGGGLRGLQAIFRPKPAWVPYATPDPAVFLCSSATPPGPGVHGMCGFHAARVALRRVFGRHDGEHVGSATRPVDPNRAG